MLTGFPGECFQRQPHQSPITRTVTNQWRPLLYAKIFFCLLLLEMVVSMPATEPNNNKKKTTGQKNTPGIFRRGKRNPVNSALKLAKVARIQLVGSYDGLAQSTVDRSHSRIKDSVKTTSRKSPRLGILSRRKTKMRLDQLPNQYKTELLKRSQQQQPIRTGRNRRYREIAYQSKIDGPTTSNPTESDEDKFGAAKIYIERKQGPTARKLTESELGKLEISQIPTENRKGLRQKKEQIQETQRLQGIQRLKKSVEVNKALVIQKAIGKKETPIKKLQQNQDEFILVNKLSDVQPKQSKQKSMEQYKTLPKQENEENKYMLNMHKIKDMDFLIPTQQHKKRVIQDAPESSYHSKLRGISPWALNDIESGQYFRYLRHQMMKVLSSPNANKLQKVAAVDLMARFIFDMGQEKAQIIDLAQEKHPYGLKGLAPKYLLTHLEDFSFEATSIDPTRLVIDASWILKLLDQHPEGFTNSPLKPEQEMFIRKLETMLGAYNHFDLQRLQLMTGKRLQFFWKRGNIKLDQLKDQAITCLNKAILQSQAAKTAADKIRTQLKILQNLEGLNDNLRRKISAYYRVNINQYCQQSYDQLRSLIASKKLTLVPNAKTSQQAYKGFVHALDKTLVLSGKDITVLEKISTASQVIMGLYLGKGDQRLLKTQAENFKSLIQAADHGIDGLGNLVQKTVQKQVQRRRQLDSQTRTSIPGFQLILEHIFKLMDMRRENGIQNSFDSVVGFQIQSMLREIIANEQSKKLMEGILGMDSIQLSKWVYESPPDDQESKTATQIMTRSIEISTLNTQFYKSICSNVKPKQLQKNKLKKRMFDSLAFRNKLQELHQEGRLPHFISMWDLTPSMMLALIKNRFKLDQAYLRQVIKDQNIRPQQHQIECLLREVDYEFIHKTDSKPKKSSQLNRAPYVVQRSSTMSGPLQEDASTSGPNSKTTSRTISGPTGKPPSGRNRENERRQLPNQRAIYHTEYYDIENRNGKV